MANNFNVVKNYCEDILSNRIVHGRYCELAVKRFLNDLDKSKSSDYPFFLDVDAAEQVIAFAETLVIPDIEPTEDNPKRQLRLLPWMKFVYFNVWGWKEKSDPSKRRFNDCYIEVARKNSKTTSILFPWILYDFLTTNAAESYFVSKDLEQSKKSYKELQNIIKADPDLTQYCEMNSQTVICKSSRIAFFCDDSVGIDAYKNSCSIIDEYHAYDSDRIVTAFRYGGRARKNRLIVKITSAGLDISKPCYQENIAAKNLLEGLAENEREFTIIFAYDQGDDWKNADILKKANPSMDELPVLNKETLLQDLADALEKPSHQPDYITKTCGIWTTDVSGWIPLNKFKDYQPRAIDYSLLKGSRCSLSFDLSEINDLSALTLCFNQGNKYYFKHQFFCPENSLKERYSKEHVAFRTWVQNGTVIATPGDVVDYSYIFEIISQWVKEYQPSSMYYDAWHSSSLIDRCEEIFPKLLMVPFNQSLKGMSPATKDYEQLIYEQKIIDNNPVIEWMLGNVVVKPDTNGNYKPLKVSKASTKRIDGIVTSIMALAACRNQEENPKQFASFEDLLSSF